MPRPRIAIATCSGYDDLKVDEELLARAFEARGAEARRVIWDAAGADWDVDLCLVRSTWDYHDKHPEFLAWTRRVEAAASLHNPAGLIAWNSEKTYLRQLAGRGVPTVPTVWVARGSALDAEGVLAERGWAEAVIKPAVDLGAKNLHRVRAGAGEAQSALEAVFERHEAMVQPFLPSLESEGELSLVYFDGELSHAVRKRPAPGDFRVQSIWGGTMTPAKPEAREAEIGELALSQLDEVPLYARVDLVSDLNGIPALIELELIEPNLYLSTNPTAADRLADAALTRLSQRGRVPPPQTLNIEP
jgi:glutathione synthase/RimK-type ligase-like ATP-grasp enzyme